MAREFRESGLKTKRERTAEVVSCKPPIDQFRLSPVSNQLGVLTGAGLGRGVLAAFAAGVFADVAGFIAGDDFAPGEGLAAGDGLGTGVPFTAGEAAADGDAFGVGEADAAAALVFTEDEAITFHSLLRLAKVSTKR